MKLKGYARYVGFFGFLLVLSIFATNVFGATDTITINVTIEEYAAISVSPDSMNFTGNPGVINNSINFSVTNIGSANVTNMFVYTSTITDEAINPLPSGTAESYASTGFIFISNDTEDAPYIAGRLEWNLTSILQGEVLDLDAGTVNYSHGYYRNATFGDYLWKLENGTNGFCNDTGANFTIITTAENGTDEHRDFSTETIVSATADANTANWSIFSFTSGPLANHCVAGYVDCTKVYIYKYDQRTTPDDFTGCGQVSNFDNTNPIVPGAEISGKMFASIPSGTPEGQAIIGTITFSAS